MVFANNLLWVLWGDLADCGMYCPHMGIVFDHKQASGAAISAQWL